MAKKQQYTTNAQIRTHSKAGRHPCGDSFYLDTKPSGAKAFVLRVSVNGKVVERGLGAYPTVSLKEAREKARQWAIDLRRGDLVGQRAGKQVIVPVVDATTFRTAADEVYKLRQSGWKTHSQHRLQWGQSLERYVFPHIGDKPVSTISKDDIVSIFVPIWSAQHATATKLLSRVGMVLDWAIAMDLRTDNPAKANGPLRHLLPSVEKSEKHHSAIPYEDIAEFMRDLRQQYYVPARALEFTILTACRTSEVLQAKWSEIDKDNAVWLIPAKRMKGKIEHRVPLSTQAIALLKTVEPLRGSSDWLFPSRYSHLSNMAMLQQLRRMRPGMTVHGFRSSFRNWAGEVAKATHGAAESALAHKVAVSKVEEAYHQANYFMERCDLMQQWADYCDGKVTSKAETFLNQLKAAGLSKSDILAALEA
jgi:integrase